MPPRCSRDAAEVQPRHSRDTAETPPRHSRDTAGLSRASTRYEPAGRKAATSPHISAISPHISRLDAVRARRQGSSQRRFHPPRRLLELLAPGGRLLPVPRLRVPPPESSNPVWVQSPGWCGRPNHGREDGTCAVHSEHRVSTRDLGRSGEIWGDRAVHSEQRVRTRDCERAANTAERGGECRRTNTRPRERWLEGKTASSASSLGGSGGVPVCVLVRASPRPCRASVLGERLVF